MMGSELVYVYVMIVYNTTLDLKRVLLVIFH